MFEKLKLFRVASVSLLVILLAACDKGVDKTANSATSSVIPVTEENFAHAESSLYFQKQQDKFPVNQWQHVRQMADKDHQDIIRMNADTAYSIAIVDVSEGATISLPASDAYQSILVIDENHYMPYVIYSGESVFLSKKDLTIGEHVYLLMRTSSENMQSRQDAAVIDAKSAKPFTSKNYNQNDLNALRTKLIGRMAEVQARSHLAFGKKDEVDPVVHLVASAAGWAGLPATHAMYLPDMTVIERSGVCSAVTFEAPNLQYDKGAFWSITAYNAEGWIATDNFAINSKSAKANGNGTYTVHFNCEGTVNNINVPENWNATFRMYMPVDVQETLMYMKELINNPVAPVEIPEAG